MEQKATLHNGFYYGAGTKKGFLRMQRQGIPRPLFRIEDRLAKLIAQIQRTYVKKLAKDLKLALNASGLVTDGIDEDPDGNLDDLLAFFDEMAKEATSAEESAMNRASVANVENTLSQSWNEEASPEEETYLKDKIAGLYKQNQKDYLGRLKEDASDELVQIINRFDIDKQKLFDANMDRLRELFLDNSAKRILWEQEALKREFLKTLNDYVNGESETLEINKLVDRLSENTTIRMGRFFARDQLARFNKALTIATYESAKVKKVKWVTVGDVRVRKSHKNLNGHIFDIDNLPPEVDDYNCRCGLVPVEYEE